MPANKKSLLPLIVFSQFAGTSLWFATNAIINEIQPATDGFANSTSIVQLGFIAGTLVFSLLTIADRFPASIVFFISSLIASVANLSIITIAGNVEWLYIIRFITGFFLAGIYPVGMKIAADCFPEKLGNALGYLVGALVLGTAFPHILKAQLQELNWHAVIYITSALSFTGGLLVLVLIPQQKNTVSRSINFTAAFSVFQSQNFRASALGYFGHMWELYAFWAFVPAILSIYNTTHQSIAGAGLVNVPLWSFIIIAFGSAGCIVGGSISQKLGSKKIAFYSLAVSGACCLLSPLIFQLPQLLFLTVMLTWGASVVADSPQFSTLVAQNAPAHQKGTALTIVTSIGFAITIVSIQILKLFSNEMGKYVFAILLAGPLFGLLALSKFRQQQ